MGYHIEFNCLLVVNKDILDLNSIKEGNTYSITKNKERVYPVNIPIEICNDDYEYYGKITVRKLSLEKDQTHLEFEVLKIFSELERKIYTENFIKL